MRNIAESPKVTLTPKMNTNNLLATRYKSTAMKTPLIVDKLGGKNV